ncbi:MAG TPA: Si-specific NAD(P)(+) transhydrogenase [Candidatus Binatia bacterium]|jgi:NAD(P) transhydrogenase|nr:Si-specific NAD(P)(+) transhydrogenase [Candidatus Binatia bacterium]
MANTYDLAVIGSGPAGQKAAIQAAKLGKHVAIIDRSNCMGGMCIHYGAIPSKTLREAILYFTGFYHRQTYGVQRRRDLTIQDLLGRCTQVVENETSVVIAQLERNRVEVVEGQAAFADEHTLKVSAADQTLSLTADHIIIAAGTVPARPDSIPFEDGVIIDANGLSTFSQLPRSLIVIGAGVIGTEYTSILALLGIEVTLIDQKPYLLDFVDQEIAEALSYHMRDVGVILHMNEEVVAIGKTPNGKVRATLKSGKRILADALLYAVGRYGATATLGLEGLGIQHDERGRIVVNERFQTALPHIYAVGDVIGFPSLASTSMEQGRLAACHAFGLPTSYRPNLLPYGIFTVPEISMVGQNEKQLTKDGIPYEIGVARYREIARGQILGDKVGMLKLLFHPESRQLLGVHAIGQGATELIHIGQTALAFNGTLDFFIENTFNYPTLAECYRVAALDGYNKVVAGE